MDAKDQVKVMTIKAASANVIEMSIKGTTLGKAYERAIEMRLPLVELHAILHEYVQHQLSLQIATANFMQLSTNYKEELLQRTIAKCNALETQNRELTNALHLARPTRSL